MWNKNINLLNEMITKGDKIALIGHFNPDGDSVGSTTGFYNFLQQFSKDSTIIYPSGVPQFLRFLLPEQNVLEYPQDNEKIVNCINDSDLIVCLDFNAFSRTENLKHLLAQSKAKKILIDHHINPDINSFNLVFSDTEVSSTCELLYKILTSMPQIGGDADKLSFATGQSLYVGMMTDTNNYSNSVFPFTLEMASQLLSKGVDKDAIQNKVFGAYSVDRMRLMGYLLYENMVYLPEYNAAFMTLSLEDQKRFNYQKGDNEGFVNLALSIKGVTISAFFTESEEFIRVSLRSKGDISVNIFSGAFFNGGGHKNAAGGKLFIPFNEVPDYFKNAIKEFKKDN